MAYHMLTRKEPYREVGADYFDQLRPEATAKCLQKRLEALGYHVTLQKQAGAALA
jgi:transposase